MCSFVVLYRQYQRTSNISSSSSKKIYLYRKGNFTQLRHDLSAFAVQFFKSVPSSRSVTDNWLMFKQTILTALEKHIPSKMVNDCCRRPPWLNSRANEAIKKRDRLANVDRERYRKARNTATTTIQSEYEKSDSQPFRSRANSLPGANRPIELWPIRSLELSLPGPFAPWPIRSVALSLPGTFAPAPFRSLAFSLLD